VSRESRSVERTAAVLPVRGEFALGELDAGRLDMTRFDVEPFELDDPPPEGADGADGGGDDRGWAVPDEGSELVRPPAEPPSESPLRAR
jgi:hypothetical protein